MIMLSMFLIAVLLSYGLWFWFDLQEKKLDEKYGGNSNEGFESNLNKPIASETPMWRK